MGKIKILQLLCPLRHCIAGIAFNIEERTEDEAKKYMTLGLQQINANPWCTVCGSRELKFETSETSYNSMKEIAPYLINEAIKNSETREQIAKIRQMARNN